MRDEFPPAWLSERYSVLRQRGAAVCQRVWRAAAPVGHRGLRTITDASKQGFDRLRTTPWRTMMRRYKVPLLVLGGVLLAVFLLIKAPQWQAARWEGRIEAKEVAKQESDTRTTVVQAIGGAVLFIGLYFTLRNLQLTQDRQITEHYTRAVEQLGSEKLEVRLGAIYALERIARDSERDHWPIMEILTAYVREHTYWDEETREEVQDYDYSLWSRTHEGEEHREGVPPRLTTDIQAILTVLGRRTRSYGKGEDQPLNLSCTDLHEADLRKADLAGADLSVTNLRGADLHEADLRNAILAHAHLFYADLMGAKLQGADLFGATLHAAHHLTVEQLSAVATLYGAHLDPHLLAQIEQRYPHLLEKRQD